MDKVKYIGKTTLKLTNGKAYEVIHKYMYSSNYYMFTIINDNGNTDQYTSSDRFMDGASEYRDQAINEILS